MRFVSWKRVRTWKCEACGECCKQYNIPLKANEYAKIFKNFGSEVFDFKKSPGKVYLKRKEDGRCIMQRYYLGKWICGLQNIKPIVCKLFPFLISKPFDKRALFNYKGNAYNVYLEKTCKNIILGKPSREFVFKIIPEAIELSMNTANNPYYLTSDFVRRFSIFRPLVLTQNQGINDNFIKSSMEKDYLNMKK